MILALVSIVFVYGDIMSFVFDKGFKVARFRKHYKEFYPSQMTPECKAFITSQKLDLSKPILIVNGNDWMKPVFLSLFLQKGFVDYKLMSGYSLLDVYLGNNDEITTVMDIKPEVLCIYLGYGEFENKRQGDIIIQVIQNLVIEGKTVWIYFRGNEMQLENRCPGLRAFFKQNKYNCVFREGGVRKLSDEI